MNDYNAYASVKRLLQGRAKHEDGILDVVPEWQDRRIREVNCAASNDVSVEKRDGVHVVQVVDGDDCISSAGYSLSNR